VRSSGGLTHRLQAHSEFRRVEFAVNPTHAVRLVTSREGGVLEYLSCFSGIGGLEASTSPALLCEADPEVVRVLRLSHPGIEIHDDVCSLRPPKVEVVAGGWPCQDISIAGKQAGLSGLRSRLLLDMLRVATEAGAHTVVAENVTNLLKMRSGEEFRASLLAFEEAGFPHVGWRILNAREFGLPQNRSRLILIASREIDIVATLFRPLDSHDLSVHSDPQAAGFYWTAGIHSINYSKGYVPTIKIGSSLGIASPPAVHYGQVVRQLSADEALSLQGFDLQQSLFPSATAAYRAAGNAVARPIGRWVLDGLDLAGSVPEPTTAPSQGELWGGDTGRVGSGYARVGLRSDGRDWEVLVESVPLATNLDQFLDLGSESRLSPRAAAGLLNRLNRSGHACPENLRDALEVLAGGVVGAEGR
jgi:DNA (cytosine-5)-methyltransferase 1